jgi:alkyldihydroxyacetonephosphate synthase
MRKSFWAWGWEERLPSAEVLRAVGEQLAGLFGSSLPEPRPIPWIEKAIASVPRAPAPPPASIASFCDASPEARVRHTYGRAYPDLLRGFACDFAAAPDFVCAPGSEEEVARALEACAAKGITVTPYGGGTSVVGGVEGGGRGRPACALDLARLSRVLEVDAVSRAARIQAGALGPDLEERLQEHGLTLRHFPQSFEFSTLGGWIATRAGGHFATLHTRIDDAVESVRMITPAGAWASRRFPASGAGPNPDRLALGSEGILGVITEAWVRLHPAPRHRASATVAFADFLAGARACKAIAQAGLYPANCRLLDPAEAMLNRVGDGDALLLLAFESADHPLEPWMSRALELAADAGGVCPRGPVYRDGGEKARAAESTRWREAFFAAPYLQSGLVSIGILADTFETACTWDRFEALHAGVVAATSDALRRICGAGTVTCRLTHVYPDGPAPYFTMVAPARPGAELAQWAEIKSAASEAVLAAGGTITHHHAVGRTHRPWYDRERPDPFASALRAAKRALDPEGILNPGVLLD